MDFKKLASGIYERSKALILQPKDEWKNILEENVTMNLVVRNFLLPLLLLSTVASLLGRIIQKVNIGLDGNLLMADGLREFFGFLLSVYASTYLVNELVKSFGGTKNLRRSANLVIYSSAPSLIISMVTGLIPALYPLGVLGLYSFYIFYVGIPVLFEDIPEQKHIGFFITSVLLMILVFAFIRYFLTTFLMAFA
ncbi:Yip1 family protein [Prolixibacter denitrificans]|uniref:Yip1-like protein n=1 Tax=Prolixibacter denitrificans TaxID=1541063 RepID=A0A2P8CCW8_9BACT|nr:Yip1 family protein [Prolixibacter denitrificans]PSK82810.1 Yip1-like protein [Prolixibacter denitrificans]GET21375.1 hypothetical protein JCM18694_16210 [Prolixibacter denitrificans]